jgi:dihydrofolate reductase
LSVSTALCRGRGPEEDTSCDFELGGWTVKYFDEVVGATLGDTFSAPFDLLLGRRTYDIFAAHWPRVASDPVAAGVDEGEGALARTFNAVTKYVATHFPNTLKWQKSEALGADIVARLRELKQTDGPILLVQGSSDLIQTLLANDLVDEFRLLIFPVVLGKGKRLFGRGTAPAAFKVRNRPLHPTAYWPLPISAKVTSRSDHSLCQHRAKPRSGGLAWRAGLALSEPIGTLRDQIIQQALAIVRNPS